MAASSPCPLTNTTATYNKNDVRLHLKPASLFVCIQYSNTLLARATCVCTMSRAILLAQVQRRLSSVPPHSITTTASLHAMSRNTLYWSRSTD